MRLAEELVLRRARTRPWSLGVLGLVLAMSGLACGPQDAGSVDLGKAKEVAAQKGLDRGTPPAEKKSTKSEFVKGKPAGRGSNRGGN